MTTCNVIGIEEHLKWLVLNIVFEHIRNEMDVCKKDLRLVPRRIHSKEDTDRMHHRAHQPRYILEKDSRIP